MDATTGTGVTGVSVGGGPDKVTVTVMAGTPPSTPSGLAVDPAANAIYVTNQFNNTLSVFGGRTDKVTATVGVGTNPFGVAWDAKTRTAWVTNLLDDTVDSVAACPS